MKMFNNYIQISTMHCERRFHLLRNAEATWVWWHLSVTTVLRRLRWGILIYDQLILLSYTRSAN